MQKVESEVEGIGLCQWQEQF